jgi:hypothetical protein
MLARAGDTGEARSIQASLVTRWRQGDIGAFDLAYIPAALGDNGAAFTWLNRSIDDSSLVNYVSYRAGFAGVPFDVLRRDPRLGALRARLGLQNR